MHCHCLKRAKQNKKLTTKAKKQKTHTNKSIFVALKKCRCTCKQVFCLSNIRRFIDFNLLIQVNFNKYYIINDDKSTLNEN